MDSAGARRRRSHYGVPQSARLIPTLRRAAQFALAAAYRKAGDPVKAHQALSDYERDKMLIPPLDDPEMAAVRAP